MYSYSYSYSTAAIDLRSTTAPSKPEATPNLVSASSSSSQNYRTQQQEKQQQQLLLLYASGGSLNQQHMSVLRRHWKKTLVATNEYCGERRMRRRKGE
jgi:LAS superfamily LD-carboxypeptidase LdcB